MPGALKVKVGGAYLTALRGPQGKDGAAVIVAKAATAAPSTYPQGLSLFVTNDATWPLGATGIVISHLLSGEGFQVFHAEDGTHYTRSVTNADGWTAWLAPGNVFRIVYSGGVWPARPPGATYVEWVGPAAAQGAAPSVDGDTFVSTSG